MVVPVPLAMPSGCHPGGRGMASGRTAWAETANGNISAIRGQEILPFAWVASQATGWRTYER
jgi:hypothetical protein